MKKGTPFPRHLAVVCLVILATGWSAVQAAELLPASPTSWLQHLNPVPEVSQGTTAPLLYALPDGLPVDRASVLRVEVRANDRAVVRQEIELAAGLPDGSVVALVAEPFNQRELLEALEAATPGSVQVKLSLDDQSLDEIAFADVEQETAALTSATVQPVGDTQRLDILVGTRPNRLLPKSYEDGRDPDCVQHCDDERYDCYLNRCDPRGSCEYCETYYNDCVLGCPICPTTHDESTRTLVSQTFYNQFGCYFGFFAGTGAIHQLSSRTVRLKIWRTVTQCDGSSTTTLISNTTYTETCWYELPPPNNLCSPYYVPTYPICFPL